MVGGRGEGSDLNRVAEKCGKLLTVFFSFGLTVVIVGLDDSFRRRGRVVTEGKKLKNFLKGQSLFDEHQ